MEDKYMKIVILNGSPRKGGNTEIMVDAPQLEEVIKLAESL